MKTKFTWIAGLAMLLAGCSSENLESNNAGNGSGDLATRQDYDYSPCIMKISASDTVTFGIKCTGTIVFDWSDGSPDNTIYSSPDMQYVSHVFPAGSTVNMQISNMLSLKEFECNNSGIQSIFIDVPIFPFMPLEKFTCDNNSQLTSIIFSGAYDRLTEIHCVNNALTTLEFNPSIPSGSDGLTTLNCSNNSLTSLDCSPAPNLVRLLAGKNNINNIKLNGCNKLTLVDLWQNNLSFIDFNNALQLDANPALLLGNNPFENSSGTCESIAQTLGQVSNLGNIALSSVMAVQWFEPICRPKGWEVFVFYDYNP